MPIVSPDAYGDHVQRNDPKYQFTEKDKKSKRDRERERDPGSQRKPRTPADTSEPAITNVKEPLGRTACGGRTGNMVIGRGLSPYTVEMGVPGFTGHTHFRNAGPVYGAADLS